MKINLDELERKALLVRDSRTGFELAQWNATHASDAGRWRYQQLQIAANHVAANSPPVTLALITRIRELEALTTAQQLVIDAADNLTRVKLEAEKVFRTGLAGMPELVRTSPIAKGLADATSNAGKKLERVLDAHRARFP